MDFHEREQMAALSANCKAFADQITDLQSRLATAEEKLAYIAKTERACCPEHVGFAEYIAKLKSDLATAEAIAKSAKELVKIYDAQASNFKDINNPDPGDKFNERLNQFCKQIQAIDKAKGAQQS